MKKHRFVIVCLINGDALKFHENLTSTIKSNFGVNPQKLPAHFTIKAPFETDNLTNISDLENLINKFCLTNSKSGINLNGFNHFGNRVIYMNINPSTEAVYTYKKFIDELKKLTWLEWKSNEFKEKVFHCTVATKFQQYKFQGIWDFVNNYSPNFQLHFDNISILSWENNHWKTFREFKFNS
ncbi:2'-5' RNA ligase family protein [Haloimpatiens lingqiaonensis]|uniref:2'-5' RNA ligase family protein n=1 Tax=Haloimpatiens lingqiaonensis TaxID=1380675 RepID=UPI0010FD2C09|nr:2'-5' RNA ligase family protein [Haloimpatiens lingqiaonensis]